MPFRLREILSVVLLGGLALAAFLLPRAPETVVQVTARALAHPGDPPFALVDYDGLGALASEVRAGEIETGIAGELERAAVFVASVTPPPVAVPPSASVDGSRASGAGLAGSGGGHSDAWWQGVAMCEQGGRNDPYFGYFSFMDGSQGGRPWSEQVAAGNALLARAGREIGPWAAACVAAGYRSAAW